jgi:hypothetical protein
MNILCVQPETWQAKGLGGLWEAVGRGRPSRLSKLDWQAVKQWVAQPQRYSARQRASKTQRRTADRDWGRANTATPKKRGYCWKRIRYCPAVTRSPAWVAAKRKDWEMLKHWAQQGLLRLKYLDESGCSCQRAVEYSYALRGEQKLIRQRIRRGRRVNIFGVWEPGTQFDYAMIVGTLKAPTYVQLMEWLAAKAQQHFHATGQITVIVQDNASVHRSQLGTATNFALA